MKRVADSLQVHLEPVSEKVLLRYLQKPGGAVPIFAELYPSPKDAVERYLAAESESKRLRVQCDDVEAAEERTQVIRDARRSGLDSLQRVGLVCQLLRQTVPELEGVRDTFLRLHPSVPDVVEDNDVGPSKSDWPGHLREVRSALRVEQPSLQLEVVLRFLRRHWLLHAVGGRYAVELWRHREVKAAPEAQKGKLGSLAPIARIRKPDSVDSEIRCLAWLCQHPHFGVCVSFPKDIAHPIQWRYRLSVNVSAMIALDGVLSSRLVYPSLVPCPPDVLDSEVPRAQALHAVLLAAQDSLVDHFAFVRLLRDLACCERAKCRWRQLQQSSVETTFMLSLEGGGVPLQISVRCVPERQVRTSEAGIYEWFSKLATLRLRELFVGISTTEGEVGVHQTDERRNLFHEFEQWATPQFEVASQYSMSTRS